MSLLFPPPDSPAGQALMTMAFGLLGNQSRAFSGAFGNAGMNAMNVYGQASASADKRRLIDSQVAENASNAEMRRQQLALMQAAEARKKAALERIALGGGSGGEAPSFDFRRDNLVPGAGPPSPGAAMPQDGLLGIDPRALELEIAFNDGKGLASMFSDANKAQVVNNRVVRPQQMASGAIIPNHQIVNGRVVDPQQMALGATVPNIEFIGGVPVDKTTGQVLGGTTIPQVSQDGKASQLIPDGRGGWRVATPAGSVDAFASYEDAKARAQARYGAPLTFTDPAGNAQWVRPDVAADALGPRTGPAGTPGRAPATSAPTGARSPAVGPSGALGGPAGIPVQSEAQAVERREGAVQKVRDFAEQYKNWQSVGQHAQTQIDKLNRVEQLLGDLEGSPLTPLGTQFAASIEGLTGIKLDPMRPNKEAVAAITREIALAMRPRGVGAMSDAEFANYLMMAPSASQTAQGRRWVIEQGKKFAARDQRIAEMAAEYVRHKEQRGLPGGLDAEWDRRLVGWMKANAVFTPPPR